MTNENDDDTKDDDSMAEMKKNAVDSRPKGGNVVEISSSLVEKFNLIFYKTNQNHLFQPKIVGQNCEIRRSRGEGNSQ